MDDCLAALLRIEQGQTLEDVRRVLRAVAQPLGFDRYVMFAAGAVHDPVVGRVYWIEGDWFGNGHGLGLPEEYLQRCPVNRHVLATEDAFYWSKTRAAKGERYRIVRRPQGPGLHGLQVPVFGRSGLEGAVSFGGERVDSTPGARLLLTQVGVQAFRRTRQLLEIVEPALPPTLTRREKEVLRWVAAGRRQADIAKTLGLSGRTVENHLRRARQRLGVATTAQAVMVALRQDAARE